MRITIDEVTLDAWERIGCSGDSLEKQIICNLITEVRMLQHELNDPCFKYAGGRINRQAIVSRNETIDKYLEEIKKLKEVQKNETNSIS